MDWTEPPEWLMVIAGIVMAPFLALFGFAWMIHEVIQELLARWKNNA